MNYYGVVHFEAYLDFITLVVLCAPDRFPREEFLKDDDQYDLDKEFRVLRDKFVLVEERVQSAETLSAMRELLDASFNAYRAGDAVKGAHLIQDFRSLILKKARRG